MCQCSCHSKSHIDTLHTVWFAWSLFNFRQMSYIVPHSFALCIVIHCLCVLKIEYRARHFVLKKYTHILYASTNTRVSTGKHATAMHDDPVYANVFVCYQRMRVCNIHTSNKNKTNTDQCASVVLSTRDSTMNRFSVGV